MKKFKYYSIHLLLIMSYMDFTNIELKSFNLNNKNRKLCIHDIPQRLIELKNEERPSFTEFWIMVYTLPHIGIPKFETLEDITTYKKVFIREIIDSDSFFLHEGDKYFGIKLYKITFKEVDEMKELELIDYRELKKKIHDILINIPEEDFL